MARKNGNAAVKSMDDRMMRYALPQREAVCPKCGAAPVVCRLRRGRWSAWRCRVCDYHWEMTK